MFECKIKLRPDEIRDFVSVACRTDIDIDISYNRYTVDAKSILGVLGLDLTQALTVTCHGYDKVFEEYLNHFFQLKFDVHDPVPNEQNEQYS